MNILKLIWLNLLLLSCTPFSSGPEEYKYAGKTMGTTYHVTFYSTSLSGTAFAEILKGIEKRLKDVNRAMSTWDPESEISRFNRENFPLKLNADFKYVMETSFEVIELSQGAFDPTIMPAVNAWGFGYEKRQKNTPTDQKLASLREYVGHKHIELQGDTLLKSHPETEIDLSAIAKGFGVDAISEYLEEKNIISYFVEIGGEVRVKGTKPGEVLWSLGVESPNLKDPKLQKIFKLQNISIATSGDYRNFYEKEGKRFSHTLDPRTLKPITHNLASVTILAPNCTLADGIATAVMVMGAEKGMALINKDPRLEGLLVIKDANSGFKEIASKNLSKFLSKP